MLVSEQNIVDWITSWLVLCGKRKLSSIVVVCDKCGICSLKRNSVLANLSVNSTSLDVGGMRDKKCVICDN